MLLLNRFPPLPVATESSYELVFESPPRTAAQDTAASRAPELPALPVPQPAMPAPIPEPAATARPVQPAKLAVSVTPRAARPRVPTVPAALLSAPHLLVPHLSAQGLTAPIVPPSPVAGMETNRPPAYPERALRRGEQGDVMLRVSVSADGTPTRVDLAESSGHPSLDAAAVVAVDQWRFNPATQAGKPVPASAEVPVHFRMAR